MRVVRRDCTSLPPRTRERKTLGGGEKFISDKVNLSLRRQRADEITTREVSNGFTGFGKSSCDLGAGIDP